MRQNKVAKAGRAAAGKWKQRVNGKTFALLFFLALLIFVPALEAQRRQKKSVTPGPPQPATSSDPNELLPKRVFEREIKGTEKHSFVIKLKIGDYASVLVEQKGVDVMLRLSDPNGQLVAEVNASNGRYGPEILQKIFDKAGAYRLEISALEPNAAAGKYTLAVKELRRAIAEDKIVLEASRVFTEATRTPSPKLAQELEPIIEKVLQALSLYRSAGDDDGEDRAVKELTRLYALRTQTHRLEPILVETLTRRRNKYGPNHKKVAEATYDLGQFHNERGDRGKAAYFLFKAREIRSKLPPEEKDERETRRPGPPIVLSAPATDNSPRLMTQIGHSDFVRALAFSPNGRFAVSGAEDRTARLWEVATGKELRRFEGHRGPIVSVAYSPDGNLIATASRDRTVYLWQVATGRRVLHIGWWNSSKDAVPSSVSFSADSKFLLTGNHDNTVRVWEIARGVEVKHLEVPMRKATAVAYSADGRYVVVGNTHHAVRVWEVGTGLEVRRLLGVNATVNAVAFSPDGKMLVAGSDDGRILAWNFETGEQTLRFEGHTDPISGIVFTKDGGSVISASWDSSVRVWDAKSAKQTLKIDAGAGVFCLALSPEGQKILGGDVRGDTHIWQLRDGAELRKLSEPGGWTITSVAYSPDGQQILTGTSQRGGITHLWDAANGRLLRTFKFGGIHTASVAFSPDGKYFVVGTSDKFSDYTRSQISGGETFVVRPGSSEADDKVLTLKGFGYGTRAVAVSPDGQRVASAVGTAVGISDPSNGELVRALSGPHLVIPFGSFSSSGSVAVTTTARNSARLWDVSNQSVLATFSGHQAPVMFASLSRDNKYVVTASADKTVRIWDTTGEELKTFTHPEEVLSAVFSPDGRTILTSCVDGLARIWDIESGRQVQKFSHTGIVTSAVFSPNGRYALTASRGFVMIAGLKSRDTTPHLWDVASGKEVRRFEGAIAEVSSLAVSPDGSYLVVGGFDNSLRIWGTGDKPTRTMGRHIGGVTSVSVSSDGKQILSTGYDKTARLWDASTGAEMVNFQGHSAVVSSAAMSADGRYVLTASYNPGLDFGDLDDTYSMEKRRERLFYFFREIEAGREVAGDRKVFGQEDKRPVRLWDAKTGKELRSFKGLEQAIMRVALSPDGHYAAAGGEGRAIIWNAENGAAVHKFELGRGEGIADLAFSPDGKFLLAGLFSGSSILWNADSGAEVRKFEDKSAARNTPEEQALPRAAASPVREPQDEAALRFEGRLDRVTPVALSPDGKYVLTGRPDGIARLYDATTGALVRRYSGHSNAISAVSFSADGNFVFTGSLDASTTVWERESGKRRANLLSFLDQTWSVIDAEGRFDSSDLESISGLQWVVPDAPFTPYTIEIFMRDYFEPNLLARLFNCHKSQNCDKEFKPVRPLSQLNRVQPKVKIAAVSAPDADGYVNITVQAGTGAEKYLVEGKESARTTGVYDLRLFRDGQLVGTWPADGAEKLLQQKPTSAQPAKKLTAETRLRAELKNWRTAMDVRPDKGLKATPPSGVITLPPVRVKVPRGKEVSELEFSAYAFNEDRVKSQTARWQWPDDVKAKSLKPQPIKGRAYLITVGVNAYQNPDWNLKYAANDARQIQRTLSEKLSQGGEYDEVVAISLISDYQTKGGQDVISEKSATKANIKLVLDLLAGKPVDPEIVKTIPNADKLRTASPDDLVIISFSSHGYADQEGNFYLIPYDVGAGSKRAISREVLEHCISSEELSLWLRGVDAAEMVMIVDACHSAASVEGEGFKPGPMGSRGLGQLSYDKGIRILASTQSDDVALETDLTQLGLLTYALTHDGIDAGEADFKPRDKAITLSEWLEYGVARVPKLYGEIEQKYQTAALNDLKSIGVARDNKTKLIIYSRDGRDSSLKKGSNQQPSLFDFTRKKREVVLTKTN